MYLSNRNDLKFTVIPVYNEELSSKHNFFWEYIVSIENIGNSIIELIGKHYQIICSDGTTYNYAGEETWEEKFILKPGEKVEYKNIANLKTSSGIIKGSYRVMLKGKEVEVEIPTFSLDNPYERISIN